MSDACIAVLNLIMDLSMILTCHYGLYLCPTYCFVSILLCGTPLRRQKVVEDLVVTVRGVVQEGEEDRAHSEGVVEDSEVAKGNSREEVGVIEGILNSRKYELPTELIAKQNCVDIL